MSGDKFDQAIDALENWYDRTLEQGCGFKTEEEKQAYIKSLGDPEKHPMFAQTTEDLEGNPLTEAFRLLREEDKTNVELAIMYKEEGNDWMKKGDKKSYKEAFERYFHALTFVDKAELEFPAHNDPSFAVEFEKVSQLRSQILGNRAQSCLSLGNYGSCRKDCDEALKHWSGNIKAHFRKCKALFLLKYYDECMKACNEALLHDPENKDIISLKDKSSKELQLKQEAKQKIIDKKRKELTDKWTEVWKLATSNAITLGYHSTVHPIPMQLQDALPMVDVEQEGALCWPVLLLYPQYNKIDILRSANIDQMLVEPLADVLPELEEGRAPIPWDQQQEYQISNVAIYLQLGAAAAVTDLAQWLETCAEFHALTAGSVDGELVLSPLAVEAITSKWVKRDEENEKQFEKRVNISKELAQKNPATKEIPAYLEVHLGCTIRKILQTKHHSVSGGVLKLLVFPKNNEAHDSFVRQLKKQGHSIGNLLP